MNADLVESLAWVLIHFLWQGLCIAFVYKLIESLGCFRKAQHRYACGLFCFICMLACPIATFLMVDTTMAPPEARTLSELDQTSLATVQNPQSQDWSLFVFATWLIGVGLQSLRLSLGVRQLHRWRTSRLPLTDSLLQRSSELAAHLGLPRFRSISFSEHVREAMAVGFFKPMILIPASWLTLLPTSTLEAVIAHELAHIRRYDLWVNLFQRTVESLLFYHPAVWWLSSRIRDERELCCDEMAARATGKNLEYAMALEDVARCIYRESPLLGTTFSGEKNMKLLKRVRHVLGLSSTAKRSLWWPAGLLALILPLSFYASSLLADDESEQRDRPPAVERRDGDRAPRERVGDRERPRDPEPAREREGDREREGVREREGDRPRDAREREDDRPRPDRERGDRPPRDGYRPPREGDRPDGPRPPLGDREPPSRDRFDAGERPDRPGPPPFQRRDDDLRREVEQLRREVNELKALLRRQQDLGGPPRREGDARPDRPREDSPRDESRPPARGDRRERPDELGRPPREREREVGPQDRPDRPREGERRDSPPRSREVETERPDREQPEREVTKEREESKEE